MPQSGKLYQVIFYDDLMLDDDNLLVEAEPLIQMGEEKRKDRSMRPYSLGAYS
jgi:hypothetical protein